MVALLIVDMQNACIEDVPRYNIQCVADNINMLSESFRNLGFPVIHIRHEEESGEFLRGTNGWCFSPKIDVAESDTVVSKSYCDAFIKTELKEILEGLGVAKLAVSGCATDFCVDSTIKGAIANGFDVLVPSDGHTTTDRPHIKAKTLIQHFNWNWKNLIVGSQSIQVVPSSELINLTKHLAEI